MKNIYLLFLIICICLSLSYGCKFNTEEDEEFITEFQIRNMTDTTFVVLRIREMGESNWSVNRRVTYGKGDHTVALQRALHIDNLYEIQLESRFKNTATKSNLSLTQNSFEEFNITNFDDPNIANEINRIDIYNDTIVDFNFFSIRVSGTSSWMFELPGNFAKQTRFPLENLPQKLNASRRYDARLREHQTSGIEVIKTNITIQHDRPIRFEASDF